MRAGTVLIAAAVVVGVPALVASTICTSYDPYQACAAYGYRGIAYLLLAAAGVSLGVGFLALALPRPPDRFSQELHCPDCGHLLEPHPEADRWHCPHCGRDFRSHLEEALFRHREVY